VNRALFASLAFCVILAAGDSLPPHQGTVLLGERSFTDVWIIAETSEGAQHTLDNKRDGPPTTTPRKSYQRIDYEQPKQVNWLRGDAFAIKGMWAEAAAEFMTATGKPDTWYTRENSFLRAAEAFVQAKKPDDAIKALDGLLAVNAKSVELARITYLRGQALRLKGDAPGALKAFAELAARPDVQSLSLGALGQGELYTAEGKHDEAAKALAAAFAKLDPDKHSELFGQIGVALAGAQQSAKQTEAAVATLRRLAYGAADDFTRARAQLTWAKLLAADEATIFEAFDHAVIALSARGAGAVADQAGQLARQLSQKIDKLADTQVPPAIKAEYRRYLSR